MPVILEPEDYDRWLDPGVPPESLEELLIPFPSELMAVREVSNRVNNAWCDAPECIQSMDN